MLPSNILLAGKNFLTVSLYHYAVNLGKDPAPLY